MKKILIALALCLVIVGLMAAPVMAATPTPNAQQVWLTPQNGETGTAFMVVNTSASNAPQIDGTRADGSSEFTVSLQGANPVTHYDIWAEVFVSADDGSPFSYSYYTGITMTTNKQGNSVAHVNEKGQTTFGIKLYITVGYPTDGNPVLGPIDFGDTLRFNNSDIVEVTFNSHP